MGLASCQWAVEYSTGTCHNVCYLDDDNWQLLLRFLTLISRWLWWWNMSTCAGQITNLLEFAFRDAVLPRLKSLAYSVFSPFLLQKLCISKAVGEVWRWESGLLQQREGKSVYSSLFLLLLSIVIITSELAKKGGGASCSMGQNSLPSTYSKVHWCWRPARARGKRNREREKWVGENACLLLPPSALLPPQHLPSVLPSMTVEFEIWLSGCCLIMRGGDQWVGVEGERGVGEYESWKGEWCRRRYRWRDGVNPSTPSS